MTDATGPRRISAIQEVIAAIIFLTRLPIPWKGPWPDGLDQRALAWFPLVGSLIGMAAAGAFWAAWSLGLPAWINAVLAVATVVLLTGALHEDGLADMADGFGGGRDRPAKLAIMKDSRVGTYGALALVLSQSLRIGALAALVDPRSAALALIGAHAFSRGLLPALKLALPDARTDGVSARTGTPNRARVLAAGVIGFSLAAVTLGKLDIDGGARLAVIATVLLAVAGLGLLARRQIGGQTGDVLGAGQQVAEITFLLALLAAIGSGGHGSL